VLLILALSLVGAGVIWRMLGKAEPREGIMLSLEFRDARGICAGADVRYRGVRVGMVQQVRVATDGSSAVVDLRLDAEGVAQASVHSTFWIASPRFGGIAGGVSGLDTLVRDSYVAFVTPSERGSPLRHGTVLGGSERPPAVGDLEELDPPRHGDLRMSLLVPQNHGLRPGSPVVFRGIAVGEVRDVALAADGSYVEIKLRIAREHRRSVTDKSIFWVARPQVTGALWSGFSVDDVNALVQPFIGFHSKPGEGAPVEDGYRTSAATSRPEIDAEPVPEGASKQVAAAKPLAADGPGVLVRVVYSAVELDLLSPADPVHLEGSGVLFLDRTSRAAVLTTRSASDGNYTESDPFGDDPEIAQEQIKVLLPGGSVARAHRVWFDPGGRDLAVLVLEDAPPDLGVTAADQLSFEPLAEAVLKDGGWTARAIGADANALATAKVDLAVGQPDLLTYRGGVVRTSGQILGLWGQRERRSKQVAIVPLDSVPTDLRPK
jgi:hypothetical protein